MLNLLPQYQPWKKKKTESGKEKPLLNTKACKPRGGLQSPGTPQTCAAIHGAPLPELAGHGNSLK